MSAYCRRLNYFVLRHWYWWNNHFKAQELYVQDQEFRWSIRGDRGREQSRSQCGEGQFTAVNYQQRLRTDTPIAMSTVISCLWVYATLWTVVIIALSYVIAQQIRSDLMYQETITLWRTQRSMIYYRWISVWTMDFSRFWGVWVASIRDVVPLHCI